MHPDLPSIVTDKIKDLETRRESLAAYIKKDMSPAMAVIKAYKMIGLNTADVGYQDTIRSLSLLNVKVNDSASLVNKLKSHEDIISTKEYQGLDESAKKEEEEKAQQLIQKTDQALEALRKDTIVFLEKASLQYTKIKEEHTRLQNELDGTQGKEYERSNEIKELLLKIGPIDKFINPFDETTKYKTKKELLQEELARKKREIEELKKDKKELEDKKEQLKKSTKDVEEIDRDVDVDEKIYELGQYIEKTVPKIVEALTRKVRVVSDELKIDGSLDAKIQDYIKTAGNPETPSDQFTKFSDKIFIEFKKSNKQVFVKLGADEQKKIKQHVSSAISSLTRPIMRMRELRNDQMLRDFNEKIQELEEMEQRLESVKSLDPDKIKPASNVSTVSLVAGIIGCGDAEVKSKLSESLREIKQAVMKEEYKGIQKRLEGQLPIPPKLDFSSKKHIEKNSYFSLASILGVDINNEREFALKKKIQKKLEKEGVEAKETALLMNHLKNLVQTRLLLNLIGQTKLDELDENKIDEGIKELEEREREFKEMIKKGVQPRSFVYYGGDKHEWEEGLEETGLRIREGLYAQVSLEGKVFFSLLDVNDANITEVIKRLKYSENITWYNIPKKHKKTTELKSLRNWKRASFNDGKGSKMSGLSKMMPNCPGDWAKWIENIDKKKQEGFLRFKVGKNYLKKELIQKVVGKDEKRLNEFWDSVTKAKKSELTTDALKYLTDDQKTILEKQGVSFVQQASSDEQELPIQSNSQSAIRI